MKYLAFPIVVLILGSFWIWTNSNIDRYEPIIIDSTSKTYFYSFDKKGGSATLITAGK